MAAAGPRRPETARLPDGIGAELGRILRPAAAGRWMMPQVAAITPQYIEMVLRSALAGNHVQQWELFDLMLDTWPELAACQQELGYGVSRLKMIFEPWAEEDEDPTPAAVERCKLASAALRRMAAEPAGDENELEGTVRDIVDGWFRGVTCLEIDWHAASAPAALGGGTMLAPRATWWVHPVYFGWDAGGRLGLRVDAMGAAGSGPWAAPGGGAVYGAFPRHKFLIGIHKSKAGPALGGALLRPLAWWWCAANFAADWLLNLAQLFGLPFRWATYQSGAPAATVDAICRMLQNMGSAGWAAFPEGTGLELKEATREGGDHSPQGELLDRADRYARLLILGQTMSGSQDASKGGGKAFGAVEADVKSQRIDAAGRYTCRVINAQLIPSIIELNYGDRDELPTVRLLEDEEGGIAEAQRDMALAQGGLEIPAAFLRKKYGLPAPRDGEETLGGRRDAPEGGRTLSPVRDRTQTGLPVRDRTQTGPDGAGVRDDRDGRGGSGGKDGGAEGDGGGKALASRLAALAAIGDDAVFARELESLVCAGFKQDEARGDDGRWVEAQQARGEAAMRTVIDEKRDVLNAMEHQALGIIDFRYGGKSRGIGHLLHRRNEQQKKYGGESGEDIAMKMPRVIARGTWKMSASGRDVEIEFEGYRAILTKGWGSQKDTNHWILNGYDINEKKGSR